jgi:hypothetical protein
MINSGTPARTILDGWREQHAERMDPIRFHFMEALDLRAASHDGEVRRVLDDKLSKLLAAYANDLKKAASSAENAATPSVHAQSALGRLIDHISNYTTACDNDIVANGATRPPATFPILEALDEFRKLWSTVRTESQLRQSLEPAPTNAGPLNSGALVHRSIALMRELSPGYLQRFLSYIDDLAWIEQMNTSRPLILKDVPPSVSTKKRSRDKTRERRE